MVRRVSLPFEARAVVGPEGTVGATRLLMVIVVKEAAVDVGCQI